MRLYILRHGQSSGDVEGRFGGSYDDNLSETGRIQSKLLALKLRDKEISQIYTSNLRRAIQTSDIISNIVNSETIKLKDLAERDFYGVLSGLKLDEAKKNHPDELKKMNFDVRDCGISGQEKYSRFKDRIIKTFDIIVKEQLMLETKMKAKGKERVVAILTHGGPIRCIFRERLKLGEFEDILDCAIIELHCSRSGITLIGIENAKLRR